MKTNNQLLLKHFSSVLKNRANGKQEPISPTLLKYLSRKDLVEVIKKVYNGNSFKNFDLALMENEELLELIRNEMYVIAFITEKWSKEQAQKVVSDEKGELIKTMDAVITKTVEKESTSKKIVVEKNTNSKKQKDEKKG